MLAKASVLLVVFFSLIASFWIKQPLKDVHWDSPIYLYQAKRFADTHFLQHYSIHAGSIAKQVNGNWPEDEVFSEAYWRFSRLGHIVTLGSMLAIFKDEVLSIHLVTRVYQFLLLLALCASILLAYDIAKIVIDSTDTVKYLLPSYSISIVLYVLSDTYSYLSGNIVSEVPALLLTVVASYLLVRASLVRSYTLAVLSGGLVFLDYSVRMESLWSMLSFSLVLILTIKRQYTWWRGFIVSGITASILYIAYALYFYPLADPRLFLQFAAQQANYASGVPTLQLLLVVGGPLWIGTFLALNDLLSMRVVQLAAGWLLLTILPWLPAILYGLPSQTRMVSTTIAPLMLLSIFGWAVFFHRLAARKTYKKLFLIAASSLAVLIITVNSTCFSYMKGLLGMSYLLNLRTLASVPLDERIFYPVDELLEISREVYRDRRPTYLVWDSSLPQEYMNLVRYFGLSYPPNSDLVMRTDPTNKAKCDSREPNEVERVVYCNEMNHRQLLEAYQRNIQVLFLTRNKLSSPLFVRAGMPARQRVLETKEFSLIRPLSETTAGDKN